MREVGSPSSPGLLGLGMGLLLTALQGCVAPSPVDAPPPAGIHFDADPQSAGFGRIVLGPLDPKVAANALEGRLRESSTELEAAFAVWTGDVELTQGACRSPEGLPPLLGRYHQRADGIELEPRFALRFGSRYTACADLAALDRLLPGALPSGSRHGVLRAALEVPPAVAGTEAAPRVLDVWPSAATVPENLLRIYVHFSRPMSRRDIAGRVALHDEQGAPIPEAFVEIPEGLWDNASTRLTLFLHPGRIKRGVGPHERLGTVLQEGRAVTLVVDGSVRSAGGLEMGADYERRFSVGAPDRVAPDPARWRIVVPGSVDDPLGVRFDESLDREQLADFARVWREEELQGEVLVSPDGRSWSFTPVEPWRAGSYRLLVRPDIEDLAGNRPGRLFDVDTRGLPHARAVDPTAQSGGDETPIELPFRVELSG